MQHAKPITSPMSTTSPLSRLDGTSMSDPTTLYRITIGALHYLSITRPDIAFAVNKMSQFSHDPLDVLWTAIKRMLRYLKHTISYDLLVRPSSSSKLSAFLDVDWAGFPDDRKFTSGYCTCFGCNLLSWTTKKQPMVSR